MAGLVPVKRSREELGRANELLLNAHRAYLASWIAQRKVDEKQPSEGALDEDKTRSERGTR